MLDHLKILDTSTFIFVNQLTMMFKKFVFRQLSLNAVNSVCID